MKILMGLILVMQGMTLFLMFFADNSQKIVSTASQVSFIAEAQHILAEAIKNEAEKTRKLLECE